MRKQLWARARGDLLMPARLVPLRLYLGIVPGMDYPTGYPARSHHLALPKGRSQRLTANSIATTIDLITRCGGGWCQLAPAVGECEAGRGCVCDGHRRDYIHVGFDSLRFLPFL